MVVPEFRIPTSPTTLSSSFLSPLLKCISCSLESLLILTWRASDKAFTTETPTPWSPPEKLYSSPENLAPACNLHKINSTPLTLCSGWISTGIPLPSSETNIKPSFWILIFIFEQCPAIASSTELSRTSCIKWLGQDVSVYIPGLFLTGSRPDKTSIAFESYVFLANLICLMD